MIYTVFPKNGAPWQDFESYEDAKEYAENECPDGYEIQSTEGNVE